MTNQPRGRSVRPIPLRRAQLISPFGPGALVVGPDGVSMIVAGLDHWYRRSGGTSSSAEIAEFLVSEWRLERELGVSELRLPPEYREPQRFVDVPNVGLQIPLLRFPLWSFCPRCQRLQESPPTARERPRCSACAERGRSPLLMQVRFIAMCDKGHLLDFPWRQWVHRSLAPDCDQAMSLKQLGGASLASALVTCECGRSRSLSRIVEATSESTVLSSTLAPDEGVYTCPGLMPWLGAGASEMCGRPVRGSLRGASNLYFARTRSAIYLPRETPDAPQALIDLLENPPYAAIVTLARQSSFELPPQQVRSVSSVPLQPFSDSQISAALQLMQHPETAIQEAPVIVGDDPETAFRRAEFRLLREPHSFEDLLIHRDEIDRYRPGLPIEISRVTRVDKLRETRAFTGFSRVVAEDGRTEEDRRRHLRLAPLLRGEDWLPAYVVRGEGVFLELDEERLQKWETRDDVQRRVAPLIQRFSDVRSERSLATRTITPRFVLMHTLSHLLMNRLTFESGYSSAALRERLFVSSSAEAPMAAVLVYTAAGDADGTLGGLVSLARPEALGSIMTTALDGARWCSTDPICTEIGDRGGQGPDSCNLAACHNCALVPETACEEFNRFLDRALVCSDTGGTGGSTGFFDL
ncbi:MAG: DUF1998 domain-containing protein [Acidimicrobiales bacterium]